MSTITESYSDVLECGREKMSEGDYLKLATFLGNLHKDNSDFRIVKEDIHLPNTVIEFDTIKDSHCVIKINRLRTVCYAGSKPQEEFISGSVNDVCFTNVLQKDFLLQWGRRIGFYGMKNIKRSTENGNVEEFKHFGRFKRYCKVRDICLEGEDSENEGDPNDSEFIAIYYIKILFGIDHITTDTDT